MFIVIYFEWRDTENQQLLIVHLFLFLCIYRKQKLEKELASDLWRVNYNEISLRARGAGSLRSQVPNRSQQFSTIETRRELELKCVPPFFLGSLVGTRRSAIGQFSPACP